MKNIKKMLHLHGLHIQFNLFLVNHILAGDSKDRLFEPKRKLLNAIGFEIGEGTKVVGPIECVGKLKVGKNCWIGKNLKINGIGTVIIGDNCDIGPEVTFQTGGHHIGDRTRRAGEGRVFNQSVGSGTWIGGRSTILNSVQIGSGCVIAGCSCVLHDVEDDTLVAGIPAKLIRRLDNEFEENHS